MAKSYLQSLIDNGAHSSDHKSILDAAMDHPLGRDPYNQRQRRGGCTHRLDCSGFASCVCGLYLDGPGSWGGMSTTTLATYGAFFPIDRDEIEPGDFLMYGGPGTDGGGGGHVEVVMDVDGSQYVTRGHGSGMGPKERRVSFGSARWTRQGWRYALLDGATPPTLGDREYRQGDFGGVVRDIQSVCNDVYGRQNRPGITVDGVFGPATEGAVRDFQRGHGLAVDGLVGPNTAGTMRRYLAPASGPSDDGLVDRLRAEIADLTTERDALKATVRQASIHVAEAAKTLAL